METIDNKKIAMSLLRQCAWVWEHCTINPHDGEFRLSDLLQGMRKNGYKSAPGSVSVEAWISSGIDTPPPQGVPSSTVRYS